MPSASASLLIDVRRSSGISGRSTLAFVLSVSRQTVCMFEGAWTSKPFHGDEWLFSNVLLPSYEKGDLVIGRLYEAIKKEDVVEDKLRAYILTRQKEYSRLASLYEALHSDILEDFTLIEHMRSRYNKEEYNTIKMILRRDFKKGLLNIDLDPAIRLIIAAIKGFEIEWAQNKNPEENSVDLDTLIQIIFYGILKR